MTTAYLAAEGFADQLQEELRRAGAAVVHRAERLVVCEGAAVATAWAANVWHDCRELSVDSIGNAAKTLRDIQRNWAMYAPLHHRRAALIQERLPHVSAKPIVFPAKAPSAPLGSWTLLSADRMLAAARCSSPFASSHSTTPAPEPASAQAISDPGVSMRRMRVMPCSANTRSMRKRDSVEGPSEMKFSPSKSRGRRRFLRASRCRSGSSATHGPR